MRSDVAQTQVSRRKGKGMPQRQRPVQRNRLLIGTALSYKPCRFAMCLLFALGVWHWAMWSKTINEAPYVPATHGSPTDKQ